VFDEITVLEGPQQQVYVSRGKCARCNFILIELHDLRDDDV
jgi:hypothetical protein